MFPASIVLLGHMQVLYTFVYPLVFFIPIKLFIHSFILHLGTRSSLVCAVQCTQDSIITCDIVSRRGYSTLHGLRRKSAALGINYEIVNDGNIFPVIY